MTLVDDFREEMQQSVMIQPFVRNDGYKDTYGEGASYACTVSRKISQITKADGTIGVTTMQIYLDGEVVVTAKDRITFAGVSPKILKVAPDYDIENPDEVYSTTIFT